MRILYDHQIFEYQNFGGISRYFYELIAAFDKDQTIEWELPLLYSNNQYLQALPLVNNGLLPRIDRNTLLQGFCGGLKFRGKERLYQLRTRIIPDAATIQQKKNKLKSIEKLKAGKFDIFHPTYYDNYFLDYIGNKPYVLTVHDLIHQVFPEWGMDDPKDKNKRILENAAKIIAVSERTKSDLINIFNIDESKVQVIYHGNSLPERSTGISERFGSDIPEEYLLYVGNRESYKNFMFFMQVFASSMINEKNLFVVCTGPSFTTNELVYLNKIGVLGRVKHMYVSDDELRYLYEKAAAFIFPSLYEGFGIPILEAFSCGCPVLASNSSSLFEIGGDAVIYFEPKDAASIALAMKSALHDKDLRNEKIKAGYQQLQKFSWRKAANETKKVYEQIVYS